jgi:hypothetical protein
MQTAVFLDSLSEKDMLICPLASNRRGFGGAETTKA